MSQHLHCPHCNTAVFRKSNSGTRYKAKTTIMVLLKSGDIEFNCSGCKRAIILERTETKLRKAVFTVPRS